MLPRVEGSYFTNIFKKEFNMKKKIMLLLLLCTSTIGILAENVVLIQGTYLNTNRNYENTVYGSTLSENYSEAGINITSYFGGKIGFYSSATVLLPFNQIIKMNNEELPEYTLDEYDRFQIGLDMLVGLGGIIPAGKNLDFMIAGGIHFNGIALMTESTSTEPYLAYNLGPGLSATAIFKIFKILNFNISAMGAWDCYEVLTLPDLSSNIDKKGGFTFALSAGIGFRY